MNILRSLPLLLLLILPCHGGKVFGIEYDNAYYVTLKRDSGKTEQISIFDAEGQPTKAVLMAVRVQPKGILDSLDKLFKEASAFSIERQVAQAPVIEGFVFYNKGDFVLAICHAGTALVVQPALDKEYQFSMEQMKEYQRIVNEMRKGITIGTDSSKGSILYWDGKEIDGKLPNEKKE